MYTHFCIRVLERLEEEKRTRERREEEEKEGENEI